jgi:hypothetical protein
MLKADSHLLMMVFSMSVVILASLATAGALRMNGILGWAFGGDIGGGGSLCVAKPC